jgi:hypothetical protein
MRSPILLPEFYVVYNGNKPQLDFQELKLSDAFMEVTGKPVNLDLTVKVININQGHSSAILNRCETLGMYAEFVELVKQEQKPNMTKEEAKKALRKVINCCIEKGILRGYLEEHSSEVRNMLLTEWNWDDYVAVQKEELREELAKYQEQSQRDQEQIRQVLEKNQQLEEEVRRLRESR